MSPVYQKYYTVESLALALIRIDTVRTHLRSRDRHDRISIAGSLAVAVAVATDQEMGVTGPDWHLYGQTGYGRTYSFSTETTGYL